MRRKEKKKMGPGELFMPESLSQMITFLRYRIRHLGDMSGNGGKSKTQSDHCRQMYRIGSRRHCTEVGKRITGSSVELSRGGRYEVWGGRCVYSIRLAALTGYEALHGVEETPNCRAGVQLAFENYEEASTGIFMISNIYHRYILQMTVQGSRVGA